MGTSGIWYWGLALFLFYSNVYSSALEDVPGNEALAKYFLWEKGRSGFEGITCERFFDDLPASGKPYERLFSPFLKKIFLDEKQYVILFEQFKVKISQI